MTPKAYLLIANALLCLGLYGMLTRKHTIAMLLSLELILNAVAFNFVVFSRVYGDVHGQVVTLFVIALAACEAAVGLAIVMMLSRKAKTVLADRLERLKG